MKSLPNSRRTHDDLTAAALRGTVVATEAVEAEATVATGVVVAVEGDGKC